MSFSIKSFDLDNAKVAFLEGVQAIDAGENLFDLSETVHVDSASVAVMVAWQRHAKRQGKQLQFANVPSELTSLISLYGVGELLDLA